MEPYRGHRMFAVSYGGDEYQTADLHLPPRRSRGMVCLLHGGFWKMPYGKDQFDAVSARLAQAGFGVLNIEYRRVGHIRDTYPRTFQDVVAALNLLPALGAQHEAMNIEPLYVAGHSAGGQLALWLSHGPADIAGAELAVSPRAYIGLAPVVDLIACSKDPARSVFVAAFLGGSAGDKPEAYAKASPLELLPSKHKQLILHGCEDEALPISEIDAYQRAARERDSPLEVLRIDGGTHMDFCDPDSPSMARFLEWLEADAADFGRSRNGE